ncbi:3-carboxy-cis,cis-muconate cycloisomerase [Dongia deserti]|uniref:3-carboxy-cis,cis-muconate cycloisomerase n=1 Tax=Dongia deserti TaxID=2268030 RepID=UPI000E648053|nr:3-carboxy-cis,cis-muconate cycloisomerase [Dongia deserti]
MSVSVFDHPWLSALLSDAEVARHFTAEAELRAMLEFEVALAMAEAEAGIIPMEAAQAIAGVALTFQADVPALAAGTARDGMVVPEWVSQLRRAVGSPHGDHVHFGSTSQDVLDTSLILRLRPSIEILAARLKAFDSRLAALAADHGAIATMARTRMQRAVPITWADRIAAWRAPLARHQKRLEELTPRLLVVQFGGPVGTLEKFGDKAPSVAAALARRLDLAVPATAWHSARDMVVNFANWLSAVTGSLGKIGQDIALLAQNEIADVTVTAAGQSSAMHHKRNPVLAEILVTLARFNATQISAMHHALVHEQERSGTAWTLEWMVLPQMVVATGAALARGQTLLDSLQIHDKH